MKKKRSNNSTLKLAITLVLVVAALSFAVYSLIGRDTQRTGAYYFDLNTGKVFVGPAKATAPIETPSGMFQGEPAGVRIYIFACKPCRSLDGLTLEQVRAAGASPLWLEKYSPEAKKELEAGSADPEIMMEGLLTMAPPPEGTKWLKPGSRDARALRDGAKTLCPGGTPVACTP
jgi:hypothetical protein